VTPTITELFAFIATDEDGGEGVIGIQTRVGLVPAIGADPARVESLRPFVEEVAGTGVPIVLARFRCREDEETIRV
jgi:hypothetical protein